MTALGPSPFSVPKYTKGYLRTSMSHSTLEGGWDQRIQNLGKELWTPWGGGKVSLQTRGWNWKSFKASSNPNHFGIPWKSHIPHIAGLDIYWQTSFTFLKASKQRHNLGRINRSHYREAWDEVFFVVVFQDKLSKHKIIFLPSSPHTHNFIILVHFVDFALQEWQTSSVISVENKEWLHSCISKRRTLIQHRSFPCPSEDWQQSSG